MKYVPSNKKPNLLTPGGIFLSLSRGSKCLGIMKIVNKQKVFLQSTKTCHYFLLKAEKIKFLPIIIVVKCTALCLKGSTALVLVKQATQWVLMKLPFLKTLNF